MKKCIASLLVLLSLASDTMPASAQVSTDDCVLVFSDEFNQKDGSQPDPLKWSRHSRYAGIWSRWISNSDKVVYIKNGHLVCRAIPNKSEAADTAQMLTGAINTMGKFSFQYGKVEVRMRTNMRRGNFPAVWLRPDEGPDQRYGEIDVVEMFGSQGMAHHTVHTHRTYTLGKKDLLTTFKVDVDVRKWHVYGMEWTKDAIIWTIDGRKTGEYKRIETPQMQSEGQWTFDRPFFLILNQSVGNGSTPYFVAEPKKTYVTEFDWIRVYKRKSASE